MYNSAWYHIKEVIPMASTMSPSYENYLAAEEKANRPVSPAKVAKLKKLEATIAEMGYNWLTFPAEKWMELYQRLGSISTQRLFLFDVALRDFYSYLVEAEVIERANSPYRQIAPASVIRATMEKTYAPSVNSLLSKLDKAQEKQARLTPQGKEVNLALLGLTWYGFEEKEIIELKADSFKREFREGESYAVCSLQKQGTIVTFPLDRFGELLLKFQKNAVQEDPDGSLLVTKGAGKNPEDPLTLTKGSVTMRINRILKLVNTTWETEYTASSIQQSGMYDRAYAFFKSKNLPFYYTPETSKALLKICGLYEGIRPGAAKQEFQKFLDYVSLIKNDTLI